MVFCEVFSAVMLVALYRRHRRIAAIALPVGLNALLGNLLGAANAAIIHQKLVERGMAREDAIAQLRVVYGMTLPAMA